MALTAYTFDGMESFAILTAIVFIYGALLIDGLLNYRSLNTSASIATSILELGAIVTLFIYNWKAALIYIAAMFVVSSITAAAGLFYQERIFANTARQIDEAMKTFNARRSIV